jgi:hypothetical protein
METVLSARRFAKFQFVSHKTQNKVNTMRAVCDLSIRTKVVQDKVQRVE